MLNISLDTLAKIILDDLIAGDRQSGDGGDLFLCPGFRKGRLLEEFENFLVSASGDLPEEIGGAYPIPVGWTDEFFRSCVNRLTIPTREQLGAWAEIYGVEPEWLVFANLMKDSEFCGVALIIETFGGEPQFELIETFPDQLKADEYYTIHWDAGG